MMTNIKIILAGILFFGFAQIGLAKTYEITIEACEVGSSCSRCVERNKITFDVDPSTKTVVANGVTFDGIVVREVMTDCNFQDKNNWACRSAFVDFEVKNGVIGLLNRTREHRAGQHEVCQDKG